MKACHAAVLTSVLACALGVVPGGRAAAQTDAPPVAVALVREATVNTGFRVVGTVNPLRTVTIGSAAGGRVQDFLVELGQAVKAGMPVAQLRTETLHIELRAAQAELELSRQQLTELENGSRPEEIAEAKANALGAEAAMKNAANQLQRMQSLSVTRAATDADLEDARERAEFTQYALSAAEALLRQIEEGPRVEQIAQARAQVDLKTQNVRLIEDRISKHTIRAPFDGFIAAEFTEMGAWINSGDPIVQLIELNQVEIRAPVPADYATRLRRGDTVLVEFPELPDRLLTGTINRIVPFADSRARTFPVLIRMQNEIRDGVPLLMAGMMARVDLPAGQQKTMPLVPKDALVLNDKQRAVFVVDRDPPAEAGGQAGGGVAREVPVELGVAAGGMIQVDGQLTAGEQVVVVGNERLVPGTRVSVVEVIESESPTSNESDIPTN